ncbi:ribosome biogenesis protein Nop16 [Mrakia frigida]|uniref:Nop16p n=1 Tax=Mrakia frigida TaxID=29902 RepID=UPI003FCC2477
MANPRQRSKSRSKTHNAVKTTKKTTAKKVTVRGPKALVDNWDRKKTVLQNYKTLGLLSSLAPHLHGGIEKDIYPISSPLNPNNPLHPNNLVAPVDPNYIPKGFGRLVRDADGKVIDVIMSNEDDEEDEAEGSASTKDVKGKGREVEEKEDTEVVKALKLLASSAPPPLKRHTTSAELNFLRSLHAAHGTDLSKMTRDIKLNRLQKTRGEIERSLKRAGGWEGVEMELGLE